MKELKNKNLLDKSYIGFTDLNSLFVVSFGWLPKKAVMRFFDYGDTQMRQLEKEHNLVTSKVKARKFYAVDSILNLIENHIIS